MIWILISVGEADIGVQSIKNDKIQHIRPGQYLSLGLPDTVHSLSIQKMSKGLVCQQSAATLTVLASIRQKNKQNREHESNMIYKTLAQINQQLRVVSFIETNSLLVKLLSNAKLIIIRKNTFLPTQIFEVKQELVLSVNPIQNGAIIQNGGKGSQDKQLIIVTDRGVFEVREDSNSNFTFQLKLKFNIKFREAVKLNSTRIAVFTKTDRCIIISMKPLYEIIELSQEVSFVNKARACPLVQNCVLMLTQFRFSELFFADNFFREQTIFQNMGCYTFSARADWYVFGCINSDLDYFIKEVQRNQRKILESSQTQVVGHIKDIHLTLDTIIVLVQNHLLFYRSSKDFFIPEEYRFMKKLRVQIQGVLHAVRNHREVALAGPRSIDFYYFFYRSPTLNCSGKLGNVYSLQLKAFGDCAELSKACIYSEVVVLSFAKDGIFSKAVFGVVVLDLLLLILYFGLRAYQAKKKLVYQTLIQQPKGSQ